MLKFTVLLICVREGLFSEFVQLRAVGKVGVKWFLGGFLPQGASAGLVLCGLVGKGGSLDSDSLLTI